MRRTSRILGFDLARALAVFGMVLVNLKIVMDAADNGPDWLVALAGLFDGRAAATFVVLAGVGISLLSRRARETGDAPELRRARATLLKRALFLFVIGLLYTPIWPADILHFYGIYLALAAFLLAAPVRRLWGLAAALVAAFGVLILVLDYERGWDWSALSYAGFWTPGGMVRHLLFNGFHPVVPWLAFLLVGMALGRLPMTDTNVRRRVFAWGASVAVAAEGVSWLLIRGLHGMPAADREALSPLLGTEPMPPMPLYMLASAGTACAVIAALVALGERRRGAAWLRPLVSTGELALTLYVAHVVVGMGTLEALGRLEDQTLRFSSLCSAVFCFAAVLFAHLWRQRFSRGPLETVMRRLTGS
ncbi:MAG: DUF418 domain-containing protein [Thermoanaerobaculia bacterium]